LEFLVVAADLPQPCDPGPLCGAVGLTRRCGGTPMIAVVGTMQCDDPPLLVVANREFEHRFLDRVA
jgi:hypothetical protein